MPESNIDLILRTKREGTATEEALEGLNNLKGGLSNIEKAVIGTRSTIGNLDNDMSIFGTNLGSTADLLDGLGVAIPVDPMMLFGEALAIGAQYAKDSINDFSTYAEEISKMASFTGMSTDEMSKLYQVADDLRIPVSDLQMALKTMAEKGTTPSIEGMMELSERYLAIQDPLIQAQFLTNNFGRAGQDMARMMEMGAEKIRDTTSAVQDWMVVTGKTEDQVNDYLEAQDRWQEGQQRLQYEFATNAIPVLTKFMSAVMDTGDKLEENEKAWWRWIPAIRAVETAFVAVQSLFDNFRTPDVPESGGYAGNRASGGGVFPGGTYKVGEREVEYLTFGAPGMVTPSSAGGGHIINVYYSPTVSLADESEAERKLKPFIQAALRNV